MENAETDRKPVPVIVVRPSRGWRAIDFRELWVFRDLLASLAIRDVKLRYRQTALGAVWVVLQPLLAAGIFSFVFGTVAGLPGGRRSLLRLRVRGSAGLEPVQLHHHEIEHLACDAREHGAEGVLPAHAAADLGRTRRAPRLRRRTRDDGRAHRAQQHLFRLVVSSLCLCGWRSSSCSRWESASSLRHLWSATATSVMSSPSRCRCSSTSAPWPTPSTPYPTTWTLFALNPLVGVLEGFRWCLVEGQPLHIGYAVYSRSRASCCSSSAA